MGGPFGISGFDKGDKKIGTTTLRDLQIMKQYANEKLSAEMSMQNSIMMARLAQIRAMQQSGQKGGSGLDGLNKNLASLAKTGVDLYKNISSSKNANAPQTTSPTTNASKTQSPASTSRTQAPKATDNNTYTGLAKGIDTSSNGTFDMNSLNNIEQSLNGNQNLSLQDLNSMQTQISTSKADVSQQLTDAQTNLSNLENQKETATKQVQELQGSIGEAETAKTDAKQNLDTSKSKLNQSVKARDQLDDQLASVNEDYKQKCNTVKQEEQAKSNAQQEVSTAKGEVTQAQSGLTMATQQLASAQATLQSTPQTINGYPNPAYASAQAAVRAAEQQKQQAEQALQTAEQKLDGAEQNLQAAEERLSQAQEAKSQTLQTLQETDSKYKDMAKRCEQMQKGVENSQKSYDTAIDTFNETSANYEKMNTELQSQQGILNQLEVAQSKINNLQQASSKVGELENTVNQKIQTANSSGESNFESVKNDMIANANKSQGCGANKTIMENLLSAKDYDLGKCTGELWGAHLNSTYGSSAEFEAQGYIKNADGSFTDPRTGVTMINVLGDDKTWVSQAGLSGDGETEIYGSKATAGRDYPGLFDAIERNQQQMEAQISFDGFDESGSPIIKRSKTRLDLGNRNVSYL